MIRREAITTLAPTGFRSAPFSSNSARIRTRSGSPRGPTGLGVGDGLTAGAIRGGAAESSDARAVIEASNRGPTAEVGRLRNAVRQAIAMLQPAVG